MHTHNSVRRTDLDLLRSLAILFVLGYHFRWAGFQNGFLGVDIFFVLSGFLMCRTVGSGLRQGDFCLRDFYFRRASRILPAMYFMVAAVFLAVILFLGIKAYDYGRSASTSLLFVSNVHYYMLSGYFSPKSELNFLLHTWSLSIEVQFYIILPLVLAPLRHFRRNTSSSSLWLLFLGFGSFILMLFMRRGDPAAAFYLLPARIWEFMAGGLAWSLSQGARQHGKGLLSKSVFWGMVAILLLCVSDLVPLDSGSWPNWGTLLVVGATATAIMVGPGLKVIGSPFLKFLAQRSYSLYLWHWPLLVLANYFGLFGSPLEKTAILVISLVMAHLSYQLIELRAGQLRARGALSALAATVISTVSLTVLMRLELKRGHPEGLWDFMYLYAAKSSPSQFGFDRSHVRYHQDTTGFTPATLFARVPGKRNYLLIGDCYAAMFSPTLRNAADSRNANLIQLTADDTFPTPRAPSIYPGPRDFMSHVFHTVIPQNRERIDGVVIMANYAAYSRAQLQGYLADNAAYFGKLGLPVVYVGQTDSYSIEGPVSAWLEQRYGIAVNGYLNLDRRRANRFLISVLGQGKYIDLIGQQRISLSDGRSAALYDTEHYSTFGTEQYRDLLKRAFGDTGGVEKK